MSSPELEVLDQLLGGDLPLHVIAGLFIDPERRDLAIAAMLSVGEIQLLDASRTAVPAWKFQELRSQGALWSVESGYRVEITAVGARRVA